MISSPSARIKIRSFYHKWRCPNPRCNTSSLANISRRRTGSGLAATNAYKEGAEETSQGGQKAGDEGDSGVDAGDFSTRGDLPEEDGETGYRRMLALQPGETADQGPPVQRVQIQTGQENPAGGGREKPEAERKDPLAGQETIQDEKASEAVMEFS